MQRFKFILWVCLLPWTSIHATVAQKGNSEELKYYATPTQDAVRNQMYIGMTAHGEYAIKYSGKGADVNDFLTHADNVKLLTGSLQDFLDSGAEETVVPIIDDEDVKYGGSRLLGFVLLKSVAPRKILMRRGDIIYDMAEGGSPPLLAVGDVTINQNGELSSNAEEYIPPPEGGGKCITARDCYFSNGTCSFAGQCQCGQDRTGSYCQLTKTQRIGLAALTDKQRQKAKPVELTRHSPPPPNPDLPRPPPEVETFISVDSTSTADAIISPVTVKPPPANPKLPPVIDTPSSPPSQAAQAQAEEEGRGASAKKGKLRKKKPAPGQKDDTNDNGSGSAEEDKAQSTPVVEQLTPDMLMKKLYGPDGAYPEPILAGKIPGNIAYERAKQRLNVAGGFLYSVRFRQGPIGVSFDNKIPAASVVESTVPNFQGQLSDIQKGDRLVAINEINTTTAPAKVTVGILQSLPWPIILVFHTPAPKADKNKIATEAAAKMTLKMSIIYPPTMIGEYDVRLAGWTPPLPTQGDVCTVYTMKSPPSDVFGCNLKPDEMRLSNVAQEIISAKGSSLNEDVERASPMLALLAQMAALKNLAFNVESLGLIRRGTCTFVEKAKMLTSSGANAGIIINSDETLIDPPAGKEPTSDCKVPIGVMKSSSGELLHIAALQSEVMVILGDPQSDFSPACNKMLRLSQDVIDMWAHSVPHMKVKDVLSTPVPNKVRGRSDEGGRIAISGSNGWAYFDYHLALFGPQEVPIGPLRLQMAVPPHGCDPTQYSVRITGTVVAILRGGGCSFGIKVINAQKLGAKAVIIVNTDDKKTMRLNALPDEEPLITIPCLMVSRRIQFYLEEQLRYYHPIDQHIVSIQPTGVFGLYEQRNTLTLPTRIAL